MDWCYDECGIIEREPIEGSRSFRADVVIGPYKGEYEKGGSHLTAA